MSNESPCRYWRPCLLVVLGCGSCAHPRAPVHPTDDPAFTPPQRVELAGLADDPPEPMRLLPGDVVTLQAVSIETTDYEGLVVDEQGNLHVPLVGDVQVGARTLTEAERAVEAALQRLEPVVRVNLFITDATGHRATVVGAVSEPGIVPARPGMRLADLFAAVGGAPVLSDVRTAEPTESADLDGARLVRNGQVVPVSLTLALQGDTSHNVRIRAGDHLYVPPVRGQRVTVLGEVNAPAVVAYRPGLRITEALALAGGVSREGAQSDIRVIRGPLGRPRVYTTDLNDLVAGRASDVELAPGDVVYVTRQWLASVGEVLGYLAPLLAAGTTAGVTTAVILTQP